MSDVCVCGHSIHEHEAVHECGCYVEGCPCYGFVEDTEDEDEWEQIVGELER
jgi:hypothetical protein